MSRIAKRFAALQRAGRAAFVPFITAGDPDHETSLALLQQLPSAGADLIEIGMPFSDPMADGPAIQASSLRALEAGMTLPGVLAMVRQFREHDPNTPVVLMGYFNPIHIYGAEQFVRDAAGAGVDGLITVDLPPEEDAVLRLPAASVHMDIIRLATPTTGEQRRAAILDGAGGFLYYVSIAGVTGTKTYAEEDVRAAVENLKKYTNIPCAVGFGIKTADQARGIARFADAVVVGSALVSRMAEQVSAGSGEAAVKEAIAFCRELAEAVHAARRPAHAGAGP